MDFNIKKHIEKYKKNLPENKEIENIKKIIQNNISFQLQTKTICVVKNNILSFINISSVEQTKIKLRKNTILDECKKNNIYIRDII